MGATVQEALVVNRWKTIVRGVPRRFGFPIPIVADQENMIVAGHGRWEAAKNWDCRRSRSFAASFSTRPSAASLL